MDKGEVAAWVAAFVAIGAAWIALHNANSARRQADAALKQAAEAEKARKAAEEQVVEARRSAAAAEDSAAEARKANEFAREKDEREQAEQYESAVAEASRVRADFDPSASFMLIVNNHGERPIFDLDVESVISTDGTWIWQVDPHMPTVPGYLTAIPGKESRIITMVRTDNSASSDGLFVAEYNITFSFGDGSGRRWRRTNNGRPQQVA